MKKRNIIVAVLLIGIITLIFLNRNRRSEEVNQVQGQELPASRENSTVTKETVKPPHQSSDSDVGAIPKDAQVESEQQGPVTATAQIIRENGAALDLTAIDNEFGRVHVNPNETMTITVQLQNAQNEQGLVIEAGHGGNINGGRGAVAVNANNGVIKFQFTAGGHRGKYPVMIYQGNRQELLDFYVGDDSPTGQAGPMRTFNRDNT